MAVDPDVTGSFIMDKLEEIGPTRLIALIRSALQSEVLTAIANAEQIDVVDADGEIGTGPRPGTNIALGQITLMDADGNTKVITATGEEMTPALP